MEPHDETKTTENPHQLDSTNASLGPPAYGPNDHNEGISNSRPISDPNSSHQQDNEQVESANKTPQYFLNSLRRLEGRPVPLDHEETMVDSNNFAPTSKLTGVDLAEKPVLCPPILSEDSTNVNSSAAAVTKSIDDKGIKVPPEMVYHEPLKRTKDTPPTLGFQNHGHNAPLPDESENQKISSSNKKLTPTPPDASSVHIVAGAEGDAVDTFKSTPRCDAVFSPSSSNNNQHSTEKQDGHKKEEGRKNLKNGRRNSASTADTGEQHTLVETKTMAAQFLEKYRSQNVPPPSTTPAQQSHQSSAIDQNNEKSMISDGAATAVQDNSKDMTTAMVASLSKEGPTAENRSLSKPDTSTDETDVQPTFSLKEYYAQKTQKNITTTSVDIGMETSSKKRSSVPALDPCDLAPTPLLSTNPHFNKKSTNLIALTAAMETQGSEPRPPIESVKSMHHVTDETEQNYSTSTTARDHEPTMEANLMTKKLSMTTEQNPVPMDQLGEHKLTEKVRATLEKFFHEIFLQSITLENIATRTWTQILEDGSIKINFRTQLQPTSFSERSLIDSIFDREQSQLVTKYDSLCTILLVHFVQPVENEFKMATYFESDEDLIKMLNVKVRQAASGMRLNLGSDEIAKVYGPLVQSKMDTFGSEYLTRNAEIRKLEEEMRLTIMSALVMHYSEEMDFLLGENYFQLDQLKQTHEQVGLECHKILKKACVLENNDMREKSLSIELVELLKSSLRIVQQKNGDNKRKMEDKVNLVMLNANQKYVDSVKAEALGFSNKNSLQNDEEWFFEKICSEARADAANFFDEETKNKLPQWIIDPVKSKLMLQIEQLYLEEKEIREKERKRREAEEAERKRREMKELEKQQREMEELEQQRREIEKLEKQRREMEKLEQQRREMEWLEKKTREAEELKKRQQEAADFEKERRKAEESSKKPKNPPQLNIPPLPGSAEPRDLQQHHNKLKTEGRVPGELEKMSVAYYVGLHFTKLGFTTSAGDFHDLYTVENALIFDDEYSEMLVFIKGGPDHKNVLHPEKKVSFAGLLMKDDLIQTHWINVAHEKYVRIEELLSFLLAQLKWKAELELKRKIWDCLIVVPQSFNTNQRQAVKDSAILAGFDAPPLLINDTHAMALAFIMKKEEVSKNVNQIICANIHEGFMDATLFSVHQGVLEHMSTSGDFFLPGSSSQGSVLKQVVLDIVTFGIHRLVKASPDELRGKAKKVFSPNELNYLPESAVATIVSSPPELLDRIQDLTPQPRLVLRVDDNYALMGATQLLRIKGFDKDDKTHETWLRLTGGQVDFDQFQNKLFRGYPEKYRKSSNINKGVNMVEASLRSKQRTSILHEKRRLHDAKMEVFRLIQVLNERLSINGLMEEISLRKFVLEDYGQQIERGRVQLGDILEMTRQMTQMYHNLIENK